MSKQDKKNWLRPAKVGGFMKPPDDKKSITIAQRTGWHGAGDKKRPVASCNVTGLKVVIYADPGVEPSVAVRNMLQRIHFLEEADFRVFTAREHSSSKSDPAYDTADDSVSQPDKNDEDGQKL